MSDKSHAWDLYFLRMAELVSSKSSDASTRVGCVIVGPDHEVRSMGYNGFPRGVEPCESRLVRPVKYSFAECAERNSIYNAARIGVSVKGCVAYIACSPRERGGRVPCNSCARALINSGVGEIVEWDVPDMVDMVDVPIEGTWRETLPFSVEMLTEAGVRLRYVAVE